MSSIQRVEELLARQQEIANLPPSEEPQATRRIAQKLTLVRQMARDDDKTIEVRTGLTHDEFYYVLGLLQDEPQEIRRGRALMDLDIRLVIFLQWLRVGETYKSLAESFKLHRCRVQAIITDLWTPLINVLQRNLIPRKPHDYYSTKTFDNYRHAMGALDATLIRVAKPLNTQIAGEYLSGKHRAYGIRLQVLVAPDGSCIHYGGTINGRRHDFLLYEQSMLANDMLVLVRQNDGTNIPTRPAILADGGYAGITNNYPEAVIPRRKRPHGQLSDEDREYNRLLSHDRVIVERFFGRLKGYWGILKRPLRIEKINIDGLMRILVCLTNLKIQHQPFSADGPIYCPDPEYEEDSEETDEDTTEETVTQTSSESTTSIPKTPTQQQRMCGRKRTISLKSGGCRGQKRMNLSPKKKGV